jgi:glutamate formiminotransferase
MTEQLMQCVPNFSEGRDPATMKAIVQAIDFFPGVRLVDWSADTDHNRMVVTFVGAPKDIMAAAYAGVEAAIANIDINDHSGVHPRIGAIDVLPLVPLKGISMIESAEMSRTLGHKIATKLKLPVFFYEEASEDGHTLPQIRSEAFKTIFPDFGPHTPHPTAGAVVLGARVPLIAYNVNLATSNIRIAQTIARELREGPGSEFFGVRALGLALASRRLTQVSMNITRPSETSLFRVFKFVEKRAAELGTEVVESEVIGALPGFTAYGIVRDALRAIDLKPSQILLENWPETE